MENRNELKRRVKIMLKKSGLTLFPFQSEELRKVEGLDHVAFYHDMGLGKTFTGSEKMWQLGKSVNLIICQKSKVNDWINHFNANYCVETFDLTKPGELDLFVQLAPHAGQTVAKVGVVNYELAFRRPQLAALSDFTLMLDESSMIQNERTKRSRFILDKLKPTNVILLSGTPTGGKYEKLWSQCRLLGWRISKAQFWDQYILYYVDDSNGFPLKIVYGYKNVEELKAKMREHGASFLKSEEVIDLPQQVFTRVNVKNITAYAKLRNTKMVTVGEPAVELVAETLLTEFLYLRMLCGVYNQHKIEALKELIQSTEDRILVFYNFQQEYEVIKSLAKAEGRPLATINGSVKDLTAYEEEDDSITAIQYQAGAMGLNLQKANKIIYFTPTLSSELYEQSKARTRRIGQERPCFYYQLIVEGSIENKIYQTLAERRDYTNDLYRG